MQIGDLIRVKEFYKGFHSPRKWGLVADIHTDEDCALWYRVICPSYPSAWHPDYEIEAFDAAG